MKEKKPEKKSQAVDNIMRLTLRRSIKHRLPWLFIGLLGGVLSAGIVKSFEDTLSENLILAAFIPLIVYMSDAVGTQMESFVIRDSALHEYLNFSKYFMKHLFVVVIIGTILSWFLFFFVLVFDKDVILGLAISLAMFLSILSSVFTGLILPRVFRKYALDPANASGPVATIIQDLLSITIYFTIATLFLGS
jgi:magnesium transporter